MESPIFQAEQTQAPPDAGRVFRTSQPETTTPPTPSIRVTATPNTVQVATPEASPTFFEYEAVHGHSLVADYFKLGDIYNDLGKTDQKQLAFLHQYIEREINDDRLNDNSEEVKKFLSKIERRLGIQALEDPYARIAKMTDYLRVVNREANPVEPVQNLAKKIKQEVITVVKDLSSQNQQQIAGKNREMHRLQESLAQAELDRKATEERLARETQRLKQTLQKKESIHKQTITQLAEENKELRTRQKAVEQLLANESAKVKALSNQADVAQHEVTHLSNTLHEVARQGVQEINRYDRKLKELQRQNHSLTSKRVEQREVMQKLLQLV